MRLSEWRNRLDPDVLRALPANDPFRSRDDFETLVETLAELDRKRVADLASARNEHYRDTVYVMYSSDDALPNDAETLGAVRQLHTVGVDVIYAITNRREADGDQAVEEIETVREAVLGALVGWEPPSGDSAITYRRGRVLAFDDATLWWQDSFEVEEYRASG